MFLSKSASVLVISLLVLECVSCNLDYYCSKNKFPSNSSSLQFTKEVVTTEYAVLGKFKSLHCCAKGYRSIEWFKDSRPYPWASGVSSFILYSDAANQTMYTQQTVGTDSGNYTCVVKNDTHTLVHSMVLTSVEKPPSSPKTTVTPKDQWAELGQSVRFYCEAFVGRINLPDAHNEISWSRVYPKGSKQIKQNLNQEKIEREDEPVIGAYFVIDRVGTQDIGQYVCSVANADSVIEIPVSLHQRASEIPQRYVSIPWKSLSLLAILLIMIIMVLVVVYMKYGSKVRLTLIKSFAKNQENCDKEYDLCVLYTSSTASETSDHFIPTLQNKYSYKCCSYQLPDNIDRMFDSASQPCMKSNHVIAVLDAKIYLPKDLMFIIAKMHMLSSNSRPTLVCMQDMPKIEPMAKNEHGENLQSLLKKTNIVLWKSINDKDFWIKLRIHLPQNNPMKNVTKLSRSDTASSIEFKEFKKDGEDTYKNDVEMVV